MGLWLFVIRYPDDQFDRIWEPFGQSNSTKANTENVSVSGFWNLPPSKVFETHLGSDQLESLELRWPTASLPSSKYYIALYFADNTAGSRIFNISVNGVHYYRDLNAISPGVVVFANQWPLSGPTTITLTPSASSSLGPLINAGEVFNVLSLGGRTSTRDGMAYDSLFLCLFNREHARFWYWKHSLLDSYCFAKGKREPPKSSTWLEWWSLCASAILMDRYHMLRRAPYPYSDFVSSDLSS